MREGRVGGCLERKLRQQNLTSNNIPVPLASNSPPPQFPRLIFLSRTRFAPLAVGFTAKEALKTKLFSVTVLNKFTCAIPILSGTFQRSVSSRELNDQFYDS